MEKFKISDIQDIFAGDIQKFRDETRGHLGLLIARSPHSQESLAEVIRYAHTLKGLAATVEAWGLSNWGADLEKLFELAGTYLNSAQDQAEEIFRFVMGNMETWSVMNAFTLAEQFDPAWDYYQGLRAMMEQRWPGYLDAIVNSLPTDAPPAAEPEPEPESATVAQPVTQATPPDQLNLAPPPMRRRSTDTDVPVVSATASQAASNAAAVRRKSLANAANA